MLWLRKAIYTMPHNVWPLPQASYPGNEPRIATTCRAKDWGGGGGGGDFLADHTTTHALCLGQQNCTVTRHKCNMDDC